MSYTIAEIVDAPAKESNKQTVGEAYFAEMVDRKAQARVITMHPDLLSALLAIRKHGRWREFPRPVPSNEQMRAQAKIAADRDEHVFQSIQGEKIATIAKIPVEKFEPTIALASSMPPPGLIVR